MISRRHFVQHLIVGAAALRTSVPLFAARKPQTLYNGIVLGTPWPPRLKYPNEHPVLPPYLMAPPRVIPIDTGRQLFVDDFLVEESTLVRTHHQARYHHGNPVLRPEREWEQRDDVSERTNRPLNPAAMPFSDGVFYDPRDRTFKMWYMGGYSKFTCLATSEDGVNWRRPDLDVVPGTNIVTTTHRDSSTVWLDLEEPDPSQRFKMSMWYDHALDLLTSPDGIHWHGAGRTGRTADRSTFFHNPFRNVWVFSLRADQYEGAISGRYRHYWETPVFGAGDAWRPHGTSAWVKADSSDFTLPGAPSPAELYTLDCVAYESLLVGLFSIWRGEPDDREKVNEVTVGYSRDGFHWHRPDRRSFLPVSEEPGSWNWANIQTAGGGCLVVGDLLHFYVSGRQGRPGTNEPGVCSTGLATLRRDGFASMDWMPGESPVLRGRAEASGTLTTRPVVFSGSFLFVNVDARGGELRVEVLDRQGRVISGLTAQACRPITTDGTRMRVSWDAATLDAVAGEPVRFRFVLTRGRLYAFWVSASSQGHSGGYPAAGGPEFSGPRDVPALP